MTRLGLTPFRRLIDQIVPAAKPHFATIFPSVAAPVVMLNVAVVLTQRRAVASLSAEDPMAGLGLMIFLGITVVFMVGIFLIAFLALSAAANDAVSGRQVDMRRAWRSAIRPRALWTLLLVIMAGCVSLVMCLVPALVVWPLTALSLQVMLAEQRFGSQAIERSASLAWWNGNRRLADSPLLRIAGLLFVGWMVQNAIGLLAQGPFLALQQYFILRDAAGGVGDPFALGPLWVQLTGQVLGSLATVASWFFWSFGFALLYYEIRRGREAEDLRQAILGMTGPMEKPDEPEPSAADPASPAPMPALS